MVLLRSRVVIPRPLRRAGFSVLSSLLLATLAQQADAGQLQGRVVDSDSREAVVGVVLRASPAAGGTPAHAVSDTGGRFHLQELSPGTWKLVARSLAYHAGDTSIVVGDSVVTVIIGLVSLPLVMDEVVVHARRDAGRRPAAFVERLDLADSPAGADLPQILEQASGVDIRRYGGLGAFSSLSIRGSTSEQVLVFLDGVPLNQAVGGGVDLGTLPVGGVESIDVYRGAVPGRFGGNGLGGVIHLHSRPAGGPALAHLRAQVGAFGTKQLSASVGGRRNDWDGLLLVDYSHSDNDFRFLDDNGTQYNLVDDEWTTRLNSDFDSGRIMVRAARHVADSRVQLSHTQDVSHRGLPGIGNFQALHTRFDTRRRISEVNLFGPMADGRAGYRLKMYRSAERTEYKDLHGEVGTGTQHDRNTTTSTGLRLEGNVLFRGLLATLFGGGHQERFSPERRLDPQPFSPSSRRMGTRAGAEAELSGFAERLLLHAGVQMEHLRDDFADTESTDQIEHTQTLWSSRLGLVIDIVNGWKLQTHVGRYGRPPGFFELFGDRGAVVGNTDLVSETGLNLDAGLLYRGEVTHSGLRLVEVVIYNNEVDDLIRFVQNSQRVSRPHNIGRARLRGIETRARGVLATRLHFEGSYTRQRAENLSPFSFETGKDLPNAPPRRLRSRVTVDVSVLSLHYELSHESRHFLDRANLRPIPARTVHTTGVRCPVGDSISMAIELRNLTDNQVADLWGYPLPGRTAFVSLDIDLSLSRN